MDFKKGDLIHHKPTGCVGIFTETYMGGVDVKFAGRCLRENWEIKDCELFNDPTELVKAAEQLCTDINNYNIGPALKQSIDECINVLNKYKSSVNSEPEYKWLAKGKGSGELWTSRPVYSKAFGYWYGNGRVTGLNDNPPFLKQGQLWQKVDKLLVPKLRRGGIELNQYRNIYWQLIEDHYQNCDNCNHLRACGLSEVSYPIEYCRKADTFKPHYGMNGCKWEKSDNE